MATSKKDSGNEKHGKKDVSAALAEINDTWGETEAMEGFQDIPEGKYQAKIEAVEVRHSQNGRLQCSWVLVIVAGKMKNRKCFKHDGLDNEQSMGYFKGGLARLGVEAPSKATKIPGVVEELIGTHCQITVKQKGDFTNVYFDKALDSDEVGDVEEDLDEEELDTEEDDEPKKKGKKKPVEDDDEDDEPKKKKPADDDDEDEDSDDDEDEPPKKKKKAADEDEDDDSEDDDDEEEEKPAKKKKKPADDEDEDADDDEDEDSDEEKPKKKGKQEDDDDEEETVKGVELKATKVSSDEKKAIRTLAETHEFEPGDYETSIDLLKDIADYLEVEGKFATVADLIKAVKKAKKDDE